MFVKCSLFTRELHLSAVDDYARHLEKENIQGVFGKFELEENLYFAIF